MRNIIILGTSVRRKITVLINVNDCSEFEIMTRM